MKKLFVVLAAMLLFVSCSSNNSTSAPSSAKAITAYSLAGVVGTINETGKTIAVTMPFDTDVTALVATFTTTGSSIKVGSTSQISGTTANNFTSPVIYTVKAADSSSTTYTVTVTVAAPLASLPQTGQTTCADASGNVIACTGTEQDGDLQEGVAWPSPRFTNNNDGTITDNLTGLMWTQNANAPGPAVCNPGATYTWQDALDYAACLNTNNYLGYNDWRLPNRKEMRSLINFGQSSSASWLNTQGFSNMQGSYWSSSTFAETPQDAWITDVNWDFAYFEIKTSDYYAWPVRALSTVISQTGQTTCYDASGNVIACTGTGQDGALQEGVAWPNPRFTNHNDGTITDNLTGLMWTQNANAPGPAGCNPGATYTWQGALDYAACLNTNNYLGHSDWRLPNVNELESLVNIGQSNPINWLNTEGFSNVELFYWSSSTFAGTTEDAYFIVISDGSLTIDIKSNSNYAWPVRMGQ